MVFDQFMVEHDHYHHLQARIGGRRDSLLNAVPVACWLLADRPMAALRSTPDRPMAAMTSTPDKRSEIALLHKSAAMHNFPSTLVVHLHVRLCDRVTQCVKYGERKRAFKIQNVPNSLQTSQKVTTITSNQKVTTVTDNQGATTVTGNQRATTATGNHQSMISTVYIFYT